MKWIKAVPIATGNKTKQFSIVPIDGRAHQLGIVSFFPLWRKFIYHPDPGTIHEEQCLRDIAAFCEEQTKAWRAEVRARRVKLP